MNEVFKMKKKLIFSVFLVALISILFGLGKTAGAQELHTNQAQIISANYHGKDLVVELEVDNRIYQAQFKSPLKHSDYLYLHHNVGSVIQVQYNINAQGIIVVHNWSIDLK